MASLYKASKNGSAFFSALIIDSKAKRLAKMECLLDEITKIVSGEYSSSDVTKSYSGNIMLKLFIQAPNSIRIASLDIAIMERLLRGFTTGSNAIQTLCCQVIKQLCNNGMFTSNLAFDKRLMFAS
jgi:hypothetical protein